MQLVTKMHLMPDTFKYQSSVKIEHMIVSFGPYNRQNIFRSFVKRERSSSFPPDHQNAEKSLRAIFGEKVHRKVRQAGMVIQAHLLRDVHWRKMLEILVLCHTRDFHQQKMLHPEKQINNTKQDIRTSIFSAVRYCLLSQTFNVDSSHRY